jgi:hypothetical protein
MANQHQPKQDPRDTDRGRQSSQQGVEERGDDRRAGNPQQPQQPGRPNNPGGTPGTKPEPYKHPGDAPDVQSDVIAGQSRPSKGAPGSRTGERMPGSGEHKQRYGENAGKRHGGQEDR